MVSSWTNCICIDHKNTSISLMKFTELKVMTCVRGSKVVGEYHAQPSQEFWLVEERIKRLVRSMVKQLNRYHEEGRCVTEFGDTNLMVTASGHAFFTGVAFLNKTDELVQQNYTDLHRVVLHTVFRNYCLEQDIPTDWRRLLDLIRYCPRGNGHLFCNYAALVPIRKRMLLFLEAYEHVKFCLNHTNKDARRRILNKLPYTKTWSKLLEGNYLLEKSFSYKNYDTSGNPESFFDFYRHTSCHRMDRCFMIKSVGGYTAEEFEMILLVRYPLYLPLLQEALYEENELQCSQPHTTSCLYANVSRQLFVATTDTIAEPNEEEQEEEEAEFFMVGQVLIPLDRSEHQRSPGRLLFSFLGLKTPI